MDKLMESIYISQDKNTRMLEMMDKINTYITSNNIIFNFYISDKVINFFISKGELKNKSFF